MKIILNTATLRFGGAIQVALSLIHECRHFPEHEYHVFVGEGVARSLKEEDYPDNFHFYSFSFGPVSLQKSRVISKALSKLEAQIVPDCVVSTSGPSYWHSQAPQLMGYNLPLYIYPDSPHFWSLSLYRRLRVLVKRKLHFYFFRRDATAFLVQTDDVNRRLRKALGVEKVYTVSNNHSNHFLAPARGHSPLPPRAEGEWRLLTLTSYYPHKNLDIIPAILRLLEKRGYRKLHFVTTIDDANYQGLVPAEYRDRVINLGRVNPEDCPALYRDSDILFQPSLAECFSASYPEAMVMKKPIVTTDLGFARDICGDAALYYSPKDPLSATDAIIRLVSDSSLQERLIDQGLQELKKFDSARERAEKILNICKTLSWEQTNAQ